MTRRQTPLSLAWLLSVALASWQPQPTYAVSCSSSPLVLDLAGDGILTTSLFSPVVFDLFGNGIPVRTGWTNEDSEDAFLWTDLNGDGVVTNGRELFGDSTRRPDGTMASNGFEALKIYDGLDSGGNGDGRISGRDAFWTFLRLWIDRNHDGITDAGETYDLADFGIEEIQLSYREDADVDGSGNWHFLKSEFTRRVEAPWGEAIITRAIEDLYFGYERIDSTP